MKYSLDILSELYRLLNVSVLTDEISGKVFIGDVPDGNQDENVSLGLLINPNKYFQTGYINVNIHLKEVRSGRANIGRFKRLVEVIVPLFDDVKSNSYTFQLDDDKGWFKNRDADNMYYYNLRLAFQTTLEALKRSRSVYRETGQWGQV